MIANLSLIKYGDHTGHAYSVIGLALKRIENISLFLLATVGLFKQI